MQQQQLLEEQTKARDTSVEAMHIDEDFCTALEYWLPASPCN